MLCTQLSDTLMQRSAVGTEIDPYFFVMLTLVHQQVFSKSGSSYM